MHILTTKEKKAVLHDLVVKCFFNRVLVLSEESFFIVLNVKIKLRMFFKVHNTVLKQHFSKAKLPGRFKQKKVPVTRKR